MAFMIKLVIFDYGRTLFDREKDALFPDTVDVVRELSKRFKLCIVSYSPDEEVPGRIDVLRKNGILDCFEGLHFVDDPERKFDKYDEVLRTRGLEAPEVAVVDDYVIRGIAWGNQRGATTIWFRRGKFADVLPNDQTGEPTFTIKALSDLLPLL